MVGGGRYIYRFTSFGTKLRRPTNSKGKIYLLNDLKLGYVCDKDGKPRSTAKKSDFEISFFMEKNKTPSNFYHMPILDPQ